MTTTGVTRNVSLDEPITDVEATGANTGPTTTV